MRKSTTFCATYFLQSTKLLPLSRNAVAGTVFVFTPLSHGSDDSVDQSTDGSVQRHCSTALHYGGALKIEAAQSAYFGTAFTLKATGRRDSIQSQRIDAYMESRRPVAFGVNAASHYPTFDNEDANISGLSRTAPLGGNEA